MFFYQNPNMNFPSFLHWNKNVFFKNNIIVLSNQDNYQAMS